MSREHFCPECGNGHIRLDPPDPAALLASGYTLVPAERLARLERIEAAARALYAPETDRHPSYGEDARDGHAPGSWPWDECPKCNANRTARHSALRAALSESFPAHDEGCPGNHEGLCPVEQK